MGLWARGTCDWGRRVGGGGIRRRCRPSLFERWGREKKVMLAKFYLFFILTSFPGLSTKILKLPP